MCRTPEKWGGNRLDFCGKRRYVPRKMDSGMKYLIMEDFAGQPVSFVFPRRVDHGDMREQLPYGRVLGAGYVELRDGAFRCHGGYAELDIVARPEDEAILMEAFQKAE